MNKSKVTDYDYIDFVIGTQKVYSCTEVERVQPDESNSPAHDGKVETYAITPEELGLQRAEFAAIKGGTSAAEAAEQVRAVLGGAPGAKLDMVLLNAGAALLAAGKADDLQSGIALAREVIASGAALKKLEDFTRFCKKGLEEKLRFPMLGNRSREKGD